MKFAQRLFMGIGGLAAAAALLAVVAPKAAHAVTATLVQVVNTRSAPVPNQDVDSPGRHPFQQVCSGTGTQSNGIIFCEFPLVPPNEEVVVQTVSAVLYGTTATPYFTQLTTIGGANLINTNIPMIAQGFGWYVGTQPLTQYIDPLSTNASCTSYTNIVSPTVLFTCSITGYTVSLP